MYFCLIVPFLALHSHTLCMSWGMSWYCTGLAAAVRIGITIVATIPHNSDCKQTRTSNLFNSKEEFEYGLSVCTIRNISFRPLHCIAYSFTCNVVVCYASVCECVRVSVLWILSSRIRVHNDDNENQYVLKLWTCYSNCYRWRRKGI